MVLFVRGFIGVLSLVCFVGAWQAGCGDSGGGGASDSGLFTDALGMDDSRDAALDGAQSPDGGQSLPDGGPEEDAGPQGPCVGWTRSNLKFVGDFETGDLEGFNVSGNAPTVTDTLVRVGAYAMRSSLDRFNDPVSYRTEVVALERLLVSLWGRDTARLAAEGCLTVLHDNALAHRLARRQGAMAFLLPPLDREALWEVVRRGERLPQKSTYFFPKVPSGLLIREL